MANQKKLTAAELLDYLLLMDRSGHDLSNITINFRKDEGSDVHPICNVGEDLFDAETNSKIESIMFVANEE